tara:strand:+ start:86 stop:310 length:225 start_codon:yes stop_codon:yes gene_type:complete
MTKFHYSIQGLLPSGCAHIYPISRKRFRRLAKKTKFSRDWLFPKIRIGSIKQASAKELAKGYTYTAIEISIRAI